MCEQLVRPFAKITRNLNEFLCASRIELYKIELFKFLYEQVRGMYVQGYNVVYATCETGVIYVGEGAT